MFVALCRRAIPVYSSLFSSNVIRNAAALSHPILRPSFVY